MSKVTLQDTNFDAEIYLVSVDRESGKSEYLPIDLASVSYFEIRDDLINFGLTGNITFPNWGQLIGKLGLGKASGIKNAGEQYIAINVNDLDLPAEFDTHGYSFIASAKSSASLMSNAIDVKQTLDFEENLTSLLKKISFQIFLEQYGVSIPSEVNISMVLDSLLTQATKDKFDISESLVSRTTTGRDPADEFQGQIADTIKINDFDSDFGKNARDNSLSLYELTQNIYNHIILGAGEGGTEALTTLPLLKTKYNILTKARHLELNELLTPRHIEFITDYKNGGTSKDYTDVYTEEFAIAPAQGESVNSSIHNQVEDYSLIQPDINNLRQTIWGSYKYIDTPNANLAVTKATPNADFNQFKSIFEVSVLGKNKSNLPVIPRAEQKLFTRIPVNQGGNNLLAKNKDLNTILKSFIYLNETIVLNVKGKLYRRPGNFITIKGDMCPTKAEEIWYVTSVKHKFENGNYQNEITAVRFLEDGVSEAVEIDKLKEGDPFRNYVVDANYMGPSEAARGDYSIDGVSITDSASNPTRIYTKSARDSTSPDGGSTSASVPTPLPSRDEAIDPTSHPTQDDAITDALNSLGDLSTAGDSMLPQNPSTPN